MKQINRRKFLKNSVIGISGFAIVPSHVISGLGHKAPSDKLSIAGIGVGSKGAVNLKNVAESENIVALCDVDWFYAKKTFDLYPKAKRFWDYRKMFDEFGSSIDAVMIATADHTHCMIAADALVRDKHVYLQKPLTHSVYESRLLTMLAEKHNVATQMGNEGASGDDTSTVVEWIQNGEIGEIKKVETFSNRPIWPQGLNQPHVVERIPDTLRWDLFVGPARMIPYNSTYTPWSWRGWWEFGTGALGDMACHILDPVFRSLKLNYPKAIQATSTEVMMDSCPTAEIVRFYFPERSQFNTSRIKYPEVEVIWYDGGLKPELPFDWPMGTQRGFHDNGVIFHGSKDTLITGQGGYKPWLLSGRIPTNIPQTERRVNTSHEMDWVRACKENPENRVLPKSPFSFAGPLNECVVLGVPAVRLQGLDKILNWDGSRMEFTNISAGEELRFPITDNFIRRGDQDPSFEKYWSNTLNAQMFAKEMIKHTYLNGFSLPNMPS